MPDFSSYNFAGKKALVRVDFNVPLNDKFEITDDNRIRAAIPTIRKILKDGGSVILMSHLGRPKDGPTNKYSLKHIVPHLSKLLDTKVEFADDCISQQAVDKSKALKPGEVLLLENLRFYKEEETGDNIERGLAAVGEGEGERDRQRKPGGGGRRRGGGGGGGNRPSAPRGAGGGRR